MDILLIGSGGREHAMAWKIAQNSSVDRVFVAPGNAGIELEKKLENLAINPNNFAELANFAENNKISLTIVGPEQPLVEGIVDFFSKRNLRIFGPSKNAAQLEGSKSFTKDFLSRHKIPSAEYRTFSSLEQAIAYLDTKDAPIVIKADGLAAGKGVVVAKSIQEAKQAATEILGENIFGEAGNRIVIEEFLDGEEASFIVVVDGENMLPMATTQDHKARDNGDKGPNTGGMGAYSPAPVITSVIYDRIISEVIRPTIRGMAEEGNTYVGFLYAGLMIMPDGTPKVIEYNCRFGDPETQPIMMRLKSDLLDLCNAALNKKLDSYKMKWDSRPALGVVMASGGYPKKYRIGDIISGLPFESSNDSKIFHAGTLATKGTIVTNGGRVLCAVGIGNDISEAKKEAYKVVKKIHWEKSFYREDIGYRAIERE
ncbi:MAG: phosphoribosylamine--glycine ligase [Porticoccus sp.]|jgi:phosphoribosylamine--glycine ligase|nr:phosphoribosylamine--glycine ligase [Porticoccus sp.]